MLCRGWLSVRPRIGQLLLGMVFVVVLVSVLLPSADIGWMRHRWRWFTYPLDWIESMGSAVNLVHAILFLPLGAAMRIALRNWSLRRAAVALALLGVATELMQLAIPGRHARFTDVVVDVSAGVAGFVIVGLMQKDRRS